MQFQYLEIRPCIEADGHVTSFASFDELDAWKEQTGRDAPDFWTLYGRDEEGLATAIGDFKTYVAVEEVKDALLAPLGLAREALDHHMGEDALALRAKIEIARAIMEDFCLQTSDDVRL
jgi:hypothetical protein